MENAIQHVKKGRALELDSNTNEEIKDVGEFQLIVKLLNDICGSRYMPGLMISWDLFS